MLHTDAVRPEVLVLQGRVESRVLQRVISWAGVEQRKACRSPGSTLFERKSPSESAPGRSSDLRPCRHRGAALGCAERLVQHLVEHIQRIVEEHGVYRQPLVEILAWQQLGAQDGAGSCARETTRWQGLRAGAAGSSARAISLPKPFLSLPKPAPVFPSLPNSPGGRRTASSMVPVPRVCSMCCLSVRPCKGARRWSCGVLVGGKWTSACACLSPRPSALPCCP